MEERVVVARVPVGLGRLFSPPRHSRSRRGGDENERDGENRDRGTTSRGTTGGNKHRRRNYTRGGSGGTTTRRSSQTRASDGVKRMTSSPRSSSSSLREKNSFSRDVKEQCWRKADRVPGRDPTRWRVDNGGNVVCRALRGCTGPLCVEFDHVHPVSKGGTGTVDNCQILQARANRKKDNVLPPPRGKLLARLSDTSWHALDDAMLDAVELAAYGSIRREDGRTLYTIESARKPRALFQKALEQLQAHQRRQLDRHGIFGCPIM